MKFKTYKSARAHLASRVERAGIDVRDVNLDRLTSEAFTSKGLGNDFELSLRSVSEPLPAILRALRIPRRGTVSDEDWMAAVKRLGVYMGVCYAAEDADALAVELEDQCMFARHMVEEAL